MTHLSGEQRLHLALTEAADTRYRDGKRSLEAEVRREVKERGHHLLVARNDAVLAAHRSGIPKTQIAQVGLHTRSTGAVHVALAEATARERLRQEASPSPFEMGATDREIIVTLSGADLDSACAAHGWTVAEALQAGLESARFEVLYPTSGNDPVFVATTASFLAKVGRAHPAVAWGRAHAAEAVRWWAEHSA